MKNFNENNRKIAIFDGYKVDGNNITHEKYGTLTKKGLSLLRYNSDWNWLMRIVEKINVRDYVTIKSDECMIHSLQPFEFETIKIIGDNLIEVVYNAVLKYVEWYLIKYDE